MTPGARLRRLLIERFTTTELDELVQFDEALVELAEEVDFNRSAVHVASDLVVAAGRRGVLAALARAAANARPRIPEAQEVADLLEALPAPSPVPVPPAVPAGPGDG